MEDPHMARYGRTAQRKVKRAMRERKRGTLRSGRSRKRVKSRKQANCHRPFAGAPRGRQGAAA
jgi:hypothetical protein